MAEYSPHVSTTGGLSLRRSPSGRSGVCCPHRANSLRRASLGLSFAIIVGGLVGSPASTLAAEWVAAPRVRVGTEFNDNLRLLTEGEEDTYMGIVDFTADVAMRTERSEIKLIPRLRFRRFNDHSLNSDDQFLTLESYTDAERSRLALNAKFNRDTSLAGSGDDPGELVDSGFVQQRIRRNTVNLEPSWSYAVSERDAVSVGFQYTDVSYDNGLRAGLVDYTYKVLTGTASRQLTERDKVNVTLFGGKFKTSEVSVDTDEAGFLVGYEREMSETFRGRVGAGLRRTSTDASVGGVTASDDDTGVLLDAGIDKQFERSSLGVNYTRSVVPTGTGAVVERDEVELDFRHDFSQRLRGVVLSNVLWDSSTARDDSRVDRTLLQLRSRLEWRIARDTTLVGSYRYTYQKRDRLDNSADAHSVMLSVVYRLPQMSVSR